MRRAYKFRLRPTVRQHVALSQCLASHRELYNAALQERRDAWRLSRRQLNRAFAAFFRRVKADETPGCPRFKSAHRFNSVTWPEDGDGCRWHPDTSKVYLQGIGHIRVSVHHHAARALVARYGLLVVDDLRIHHLGRRPTPNPDPDQPGRFLPNRAAAKAGPHPSIHDAGWAQFVSILRASAEAAGGVVIDLDPRPTSDRWEAGGHPATENRVSHAVFSCRGCGHTVSADEHAAHNLLRAGPARLAANPAA